MACQKRVDPMHPLLVTDKHDAFECESAEVSITRKTVEPRKDESFMKDNSQTHSKLSEHSSSHADLMYRTLTHARSTAY